MTEIGLGEDVCSALILYLSGAGGNQQFCTEEEIEKIPRPL